MNLADKKLINREKRGRARTAVVAYGDFQTPPQLAALATARVAQRGLVPASVLEPTCGTGAFVSAALEAFPRLHTLAAFDINPDHVARTRVRIDGARGNRRCEVANFFEHDWRGTLAALPTPVLILGNPPWVTASGLGALGSTNLPRKENFQRHKGLDARTGKSNFDVAEWMLLRLLEAAQGRDVTLAMLVKTGVARRVLAHAWRTHLHVSGAEMLRFDAGEHFGVSADACLLVCRTNAGGVQACATRDLEETSGHHARAIGWRDGTLVADVEAYERYRAFLAAAPLLSTRRWRSGVKHDCAAVMELRRGSHGRFVNSEGVEVDLEPDYLYPLVKGADLANGRAHTDRWLLVTQSLTGEDTSTMATRAPRTWAYLCRHAHRLDARRSSIYRKRPRFSVFGVGPYTFAPWKVAISALHKRLSFAVVGPVDGRPVVFDDTCYHLSCETEEAASLLAALLRSEPATELLQSLIFWDAKRPITVDVLQRLSLERLADHLGRARELERALA